MKCPATDVGMLRVMATSGPPGVAISGEIDETTYGDLVRALSRFADGPAELHVWLAEVEYCDLAGLRAIVGLAGRNGQRRRVVLHDVPPGPRELLRILGWDSTPGVVLDELPWPTSRVPARGPAQPGSARPLRVTGSGQAAR